MAEDIAVDMGAWGGPVASFYSEPVAMHPFVQHLLDTDAQEYEEYEDEDEKALQGGESAGEPGARDDGNGDETGDGRAEGEGHADGGEAKTENKPDFVIEDETVRYWSDFLKVSFHHRTCHDLTQGFGTDYSSYCAGVNWDADDSHREEWEENLHWWIEECDTLQGVCVCVCVALACACVTGCVCVSRGLCCNQQAVCTHTYAHT